MKTLHQQYGFVQGARGVLFNYLGQIPFAKLNLPLEAFANKTILHLLNHIAASYLSWLSEFALQTPFVVKNEAEWHTVNDIIAYYNEVNNAMFRFLAAFDSESTEITGFKKRQNVFLTLSVLQVFTHVVTHEFHHKGMILGMTRHLGFTPVDTDIIRF